MANKKAVSQEIPQSILLIGKVLQLISKKIATKFAIKLFSTPIKHKIPKREFVMDAQSKQTKLIIPATKQEFVVCEYGNVGAKVLLVHGWSGRGTQLFKIADQMVQNGYQTVSFDAPGHGKAKGNQTLMLDFIDCIHEIDKIYGPFDFAIGHSLGGMAILNSVKENFAVKKIVIVGSGDLVTDIISDFISKLALKPEIGILMQQYYENKYGFAMNAYAASEAAKSVKIPTLVIHDEDDNDIPVSAARQIKAALSNSEIYITKGLGHRKILGDEAVLKRIESFLEV
jgi:pimeloyl-ACP methyl ester carboxylesterase